MTAWYASTKLNIFFLWQCLHNFVSFPPGQYCHDNHLSSRIRSVAQIPRLSLVESAWVSRGDSNEGGAIGRGCPRGRVCG